MNDYTIAILFSPLFVLVFWLIEVSIKREGENPKGHLLVFLVSSLFPMLAGAVFYMKHYDFFRVIYVPSVMFSLLQFPSFYLFIFRQTLEGKFISKMHLHYLVPVVAMCSAIVIHFVILDSKTVEEFISQTLVTGEFSKPQLQIAFVADRIYKNVFIVLALVYFILINVLIKKHRVKIESFFSYSQGIDFKWINVFNIVFILQLTGGVYYHSMGRDFFAEKPLHLLFPFAVSTVFYYVIGHFGFRQKKSTNQNLRKRRQFR